MPRAPTHSRRTGWSRAPTSSTIRASGYALDGADAVELAAGKTATADLKLKPRPVQFEQLTNAEMLVSAPVPTS